MRWTPVFLIRSIGILLCSASVLLTLLHPTVGSDPQLTSLLSAILPALSLEAERALSLVSPLLIGTMLWICTGERLYRQASTLPVALLAIQTALALLIAPELQFIVAVEAGLLLDPLRGAAWVSAQAGISWLGAVLFPGLMSWLLPSNADALRRTLGIGLFMLIAMLYNLFAFGLGWLAATERRQARALRLANRELSSAQLAAAQAVRLHERLAIARELHDAVGHQLTALSVNLQVATHLSQDAAKNSVAEAYALTGELLSDVRKVVSSIREPEPIDLVQALDSFALRVAKPAVHLDMVRVPENDEAALSHILLRCVQEIITNAVRHSEASNIWIVSSVRSGSYQLDARDDGRGAPAVSPGNGLRGLEERVREVRGQVAFETATDRGFRVSIKIPLPEGVS